MKKIFLSILICFGVAITVEQVSAYPVIRHNMTSTDETISVYKEGADIHITINNQEITLTGYSGIIWDVEIIHGTHWFAVQTSPKMVTAQIFKVVDHFSAPRQARIEMKDAAGKQYVLRINQNPYDATIYGKDHTNDQ